MKNMFCFQCQQTAKNTCCDIAGVCGKSAPTANLQDKLTGEMISLCKKGKTTNYKLLIDGLFMTVTNVNFDDAAISKQIAKVQEEKKRFNITDTYNMQDLWENQEDTRSLKSLILFGMRGMAAYAHHAYVLGYQSDIVNNFFVKGLSAIAEDLSVEELIGLTLKTGKVNLECMRMLDEANTKSYGNPIPTKVSNCIEKGAFIVVSGHDLKDIKNLLEQTDGKGVNIYTHGEMLPSHAYPELKKYKHLKGNFGTAWQNQQKEFENIPAPILFTTNCIMKPRSSYEDRVYTTSVVGYPGMKHIDDSKDFTPIIELAIALGGYKEDKRMTGINGGEQVITGFGHNAVLSNAGTIVEAVKAGAIKHFFLVGGCDGAHTGRNYYTEFVKQTPKDSIILTLACGKYRFNDLDIGSIGAFPRIMDMGQCNDAFSAIKVAVALAEAFDCGVNDLPLSLVLSWYEQKAVCILLTLLHLGLKNIYLGPTLPAFVSPNVLNVLVEKFQIKPSTTPENDLKQILKL